MLFVQMAALYPLVTNALKLYTSDTALFSMWHLCRQVADALHANILTISAKKKIQVYVYRSPLWKPLMMYFVCKSVRQVCYE